MYRKALPELRPLDEKILARKEKTKQFRDDF